MEIINKVRYTDDAFVEHQREKLADFKAKKIILAPLRPNTIAWDTRWRSADRKEAAQNTDVVCVDATSRYPLVFFFVKK